MKLTARTLKQAIESTGSLTEQARLRCRLARQYEEAGDYEPASRALGEFWRGVGALPRLDGLDEETAGEVLLRAGVLSGWIGSSKQMEGAQERAKDLISRSATIFESLGKRELLAEAQIELAYCYWREGAFDEARVMLREVLRGLGDDGAHEQRIVALLRSAIVEASATRYHDALRILMEAAPAFEASRSHALKGKFHNELASLLNYLAAAESREDYADRAYLEYTAASFHFEQAGHLRYLAAVENNLGFLCIAVARFKEAHEHLERARRLFQRLKDSVHTAQVDETRARALLAEGRHTEAERIARQAVRTLERGGEQAILAEALITHGTSLARLGRAVPAQTTLARAAEVAERAGDLEDAGLAFVTMIEELFDHLSHEEVIRIYRQADELLADSQHLGNLRRLRRAASRLLTGSLNVSESGPATQTRKPAGRTVPWANFSLKEELHRLEEHYIGLALRDAGGKVSHAARLLGYEDHGSLNSLLKKKHRKLLAARMPVTPRKRSIIRDR
jgi:tetratricopeptide (TPR) repeat protein